jgi:hypothetical protein
MSFSGAKVLKRRYIYIYIYIYSILYIYIYIYIYIYMRLSSPSRDFGSREDKGSYPLDLPGAEKPKCLPAATCTLQLDGPGTTMGLGIDGPDFFVTCKG